MRRATESGLPRRSSLGKRAAAVVLALGAATVPALGSAEAAGRAAVGVARAAVQTAEPVPDSLLRVVVLGTGTPNADPERSGPAVAIVAGGQAYLVDAGPGVVRRAAAAARDHGIEALAPDRLNRLFVTHLHSDHTTGLPDLMLAPWVLDRPGPLRIVGPPGVEAMVEHVLAAWQEDIHVRISGLEPRDANRDAYRAVVRETTGGAVHEDAAVTVEAVPVQHGSWPHALGYRFEGGGRVVVVSGDARPSESLVEACNGCDVLLHEAYSAEAFRGRPPEWQAYHARAHTSTTELAEFANRARPKLLVLYHQLYWGATDDDLVREIRAAGYDGPVASAADLDIY